MITDIVLDVNIAVDICAKREPYVKKSVLALDHIQRCGHRIWLSVASVQTLEYVTASELRRVFAERGRQLSPRKAHELAKRQLHIFSSGVQWLASLAEEGAVFDQSDPGDSQLIRAVARLGKGARLLTRDEDLAQRCGQALLLEDYLSYPGFPKPVVFVDLEKQQERIRPQLERSVHSVLHHGRYIMGPEVRELEQVLASFAGVEHAVGCASGTDALLMSLMACDVGPGDAVFTTPFTFIATAEVISLLGATPVFVDIDPRTFNIDPAKLEQAIVKTREVGALTPRGVIPVDLFGLPADYDAIMVVAKTHGLFVLEDAAQAFGATYKGRRAGSLGHIATTSFFSAKPLGCYGDGGAVMTDDGDLAAKLRSIRTHGKGTDKYDNVRVGLNARLDTLQAAILLSKLTVFPGELEARQHVAQRYTSGLEGFVETPYVPVGFSSAWAQYSVLSERRTEIQGALKELGIPSVVYYPKPLHLQTAFGGLDYKEGDFPVAESTAARILSLPMHPYLDDVTQDFIINAVQTPMRYA